MRNPTEQKRHSKQQINMQKNRIKVTKWIKTQETFPQSYARLKMQTCFRCDRARPKCIFRWRGSKPSASVIILIQQTLVNMHWKPKCLLLLSVWSRIWFLFIVWFSLLIQCASHFHSVWFTFTSLHLHVLMKRLLKDLFFLSRRHLSHEKNPCYFQ